MAWADTIFKFLGLARYNATPPSLTDGANCEAQCDSSGRLLVNPGAINTTWADGGTAAAEKVVKAAPGKLWQIFGRNTGGSDKYIFIFNHAASGGSRPSNGSTAALFVPVKVKAGEAFSITLDRARTFSTGLYWGASSTDATFTYESGATLVVSAEYE